MLDDCQQWQSNYPSASSTIFKYFSMKRPIMEAATAACYNTSAVSEVVKPVNHAGHHNSIKTENTDIISGLTQTENGQQNSVSNHHMSAATASSMASMAAAATQMFNRLQDTANFTTR